MNRPLCFLALAALALGPCAAARPSTADETPPPRDLNRNGIIDPYEDPRQPTDARVADLLGRMTLAEKVGTMMHGTLPAKGSATGTSNEGYDLAQVTQLIRERGISSFITRLVLPPEKLAEANNAVQRIAAESRLGIPVTISTDPRNHFQAVLGASTVGAGFSLWPETLGLAAIGDLDVVRNFGRIAASEYRAVGIHMALSPQADLATEPRWPRVTATFGSDSAAVSRLAAAYVEGFQGAPDHLTGQGVATVVKHWVGYGAAPKGFDGHNAYGKTLQLDNRTFADHVAAFDGVIAAGTAGIMPTYGIIEGVTLNGKPLEPVGAGFSRQILDGLLRHDKGYRGLIVSDWAITNDCPAACSAPTAAAPQTAAAIGMPWGVETLSQQARFAKGVNAGIDQFGGVNDPGALLRAVEAGEVSVERIDESVRRILSVKFDQGLFDAPYVDPAVAARTVGNAQSQAAADAAQRRAQVLLQNRGALLPLAAQKRRVWLNGVDDSAARAAGFEPVAELAQADLAIIRTPTPSEKLHPHHFFGNRQNEGRLDFRAGNPAYDAVLAAAAKRVPTILVVDMDRPAILTNLLKPATSIIAVFGASDTAVLDVVTGRAKPEGRLPFALPRSMRAAEKQDPAVADDGDTLCPRGAGMRFGQTAQACGR